MKTNTTKTTKKIIKKTVINEPVVVPMEFHEQTVSGLRELIQDKTNEVNTWARKYDGVITANNRLIKEVDRVDSWCWFWVVIFVGSVIINIAW